MKKICFLMGNLSNPGGTERVTTLIANELAEKNPNISILSLTDGKNPFFYLNADVKTYSLYPMKISFKKNFIGAVLKIRRFVQQHQIDSLIVVDSISCMFTVPALYGLQVNHICWEHFNFNVNLKTKSRDIGRKWAAKYCDYIVTLTKRDKELWQQGLNDINAKIIPIANPTPYENVKHRPSLDFKNVLTLGRLTYQKGFDSLIEAWAQVCKTNEDWTLSIVGSGEDEEALKDQAKRLEVLSRINFVPANKDIEQYYKKSSFYCLSSRFEGLPMVLLEAQAFGLPIVAFDCDTGPAEVVEHRTTGLLVKAGDTNQLADSLLMMINITNSEYEMMSANTIENSQKFSIQSIIKTWLSII